MNSVLPDVVTIKTMRPGDSDFLPCERGKGRSPGMILIYFPKEGAVLLKKPQESSKSPGCFFFSCFFLFIFFRNNFFKLKLEQVEGMWFVGCGLVCGWFFR